MQVMKRAPDFRDYATLSEYADAVKSAGYSFPALLGWVVQSTMDRHGCTFQDAMGHLVRTGAIVLVGCSSLQESKRDIKAIDVKQRLKDLDAYRDEEIDRQRKETTEEGEKQKGDG
jgi:hypothetical protein